MRKLKFNHMLALASTVALVSGSQTVYAQQQDASAPVEEVVVTGFRASLQNSISAKQESSSIVDAIYAEDIGKLPDTSIAESLARLPGLAGERRDGRTSGLSVRGFNENYVATTMNGRELLGIGDNRGVEYDLYPSEIISGAVVYKTPDATLVNQGLGGIVDLRTLRPLELSDRIISINANYEQNGLKSNNPEFDDNGHRVALTYADQYNDGTIGVALTVASMESPNQEEQFRAWDNNGAWPTEPMLIDDELVDVAVLGGQDSYVRSSMMERDTVAAVIQFQPDDRVTFTLDALYIDFTESKVFRGLEEAVFWGAPNNTFDNIQDGLAMSGTTEGFHSVIRNDGEVKDGELTTFGFNVKYQLTDAWAVALDVATSESSKKVLSVESYSGTGRAGSDTQGGPSARSWTLTSNGVVFGPHPTIAMPDYTDPDVIRLAGPQAWGGGVSFAFNGQSDAQDGFVNRPTFEEELNTIRLQASGEVEFGIVNGLEFGLNYSDRSKSKVNNGEYLTAPTWVANPEPGAKVDDAVPAEYVVGVADLSFLGIEGILAYDGIGLYKDGYYIRTDAGIGEATRLGDTYEVDEKVTTAFAMAKFETGILSGNVGLQIIDTDQSGRGYETLNGSNGGRVEATPVTDGADYTQILPSLNMNFDVAEGHITRFAAAKTASRARIDSLKPNNVIGFNFDQSRRLSDDPNFSAWSKTQGTSQLRPLEAIQFDVSHEYYYARDGFISLTYFFKDIQNWHFNDQEIIDFSSYIVPGYHDQGIAELVSTTGPSTTIRETGKGSIQGTELQASIPFHLFSDALDGFGLIASVTNMEGDLEDASGNKFRIPGMSEESYQLTFYFERAGFEFRVSGRKRDEFLTETPGVSLALTPTMDQGSELWDAQIGYNFSESGISALDGLTITLQAQNLTDEDTKLAPASDSRQVVKYQNFGANYLLGVNYKF